jgi:hypothetical protein
MCGTLEYTEIYCWNSDQNAAYLRLQIDYRFVPAEWLTEPTDLYEDMKEALQFQDENFTEVKIKIKVFSLMIPHNLDDGYHNIGGTQEIRNSEDGNIK